MKDLFFRIGVGCCVIPVVHFFAALYCLFYERQLSEYALGFFSCLFWFAAVDFLKEVK